MENSKNYIENLYSNTFGNFEDTPTNDEWKALNTKLGRINFLKFSFTTFNVFYLCIILALASSTAYFGVNSYILSSKNKVLEMQIEKLNQSIISKDFLTKTKQTILPNTDVQNTSAVSLKKAKENVEKPPIYKEVKKSSIQESLKNSTNISEPPVVENEATQLNETISGTITEATKTDSSNVNKVFSQKIKKVRKTIFVKQNLVFVKDSTGKKVK